MISKNEKLIRKVCAWLLIYLMSVQPFFTSVVYSQTQAEPDPSQGKNPHVTNAQNGTVLVDVRGPNGSGLSHNQYLNLQVGRDGIIFNNSTQIANTQLAGYINANANLNGTSAKIILNEVTGALPTNINGYMEIAGTRADLIIANPNGIVGNNFGFINTNRAVLTTGIPQMQNDSLKGFLINGGQIAIEGQGMDARGATKTEIMANAVKINAALHANDLNIVTGSNEIDYNTGAVRALDTEDQGGISLDVSALGSMYAGRITLVGTRKGLGVNNGGTLSASTGDVILTQEGKVVLSGTTQAAKDIRIESNQDIGNTGTIYAKKDITLSSSGEIANTDGIIKSEGNLNIDASGNVTNTKIGDGGQLEANNISIKGSNLESTGNILAFEKNLSINNSGQVNLSGTTYAKENIKIATQSDIVQQGTLYAEKDMVLDANGNIQNVDGIIKANGALELKATGDVENIKDTNGGQIEAATVDIGSNNLTSTGNIVALAGDMTLKQAGQTNLSGTTYAEGKLTANSGSLKNEGTLYAKNDIELTTGSDIENKGTVKSENMLNINATGELKNNSSQQSVLEAQTINIKSAGVDNSNSLINNLSTNELKIETGSLSNTSGQIIGQGNLALTANTASNTSGLLYSEAKTSVSAATLDNSGKILSQDELSLQITNNFTNDGEVKTNANLKMSGLGNVTNTGDLATTQEMQINVNNLDNQGSIQASELEINANQNLTNSGLLNSANDLSLSANTISNKDTGRIYGTDIYIEATTLNNTGNGTDAPVIASRENMYIGAGTINNKEHALLLSESDMFIGGALSNGTVTGKAGVINNNSATIETKGGLSITAGTINNKNEHFVIGPSATGTTERRFEVGFWDNANNFYRYYLGTPENPNWAEVGIYKWKEMNEWSGIHLFVPYQLPGGGDIHEWTEFTYTRTTYQDEVKQSAPAKIVSGGNITINADIVNNENSHIIAGGSILGDIVQLNNENSLQLVGNKKYVDEGVQVEFIPFYDSAAAEEEGHIHSTSTETSSYANETVLSDVPIDANQGSRYEQGVSVDGETSGETTGSFTAPTINQVTTQEGGSINSIDFSNDGNNISNMVNQLHNSLYIITNDPTSSYFIETDPAFTNYEKFISSNYFFDQMDFDPGPIAKRLGDAYYEQQLIKEQIMKLTGNRYIKGFSDDNGQYQTLMDNAVKFARENNITIGVELTDEQISLLGESIVWMVEKQVLLPGGQIVTALVPQVYLANEESGNHNFAVISAQDIDLKLTNDILNSGTIKAEDALRISASNINNIGGVIKGSDVTMKAAEDINNIGGTFKAQDSMTLEAGRNVNIEALTENTVTSDLDGARQVAKTEIDLTGRVILTGDNAQLSISAGNDVNIKASEVQNIGKDSTTIISAGNDVNIASIKTTEDRSVAGGEVSTINRSEDIGSTITTNGNLTVEAGNDVNIKASAVAGTDDTKIVAANDVNITSGTKESEESYNKYAWSNTWNIEKTEQKASLVISDNININSGDTVNISSSIVSANDELNVTAQNAINITAEKEFSKDDKDWGVRGSNYYERQMQSDETVSGSLISAGGNINMTSGGDLTVQASSISSVDGKVTLEGENVQITALEENHSSIYELERKTKGTFSKKSTKIYDYQSGDYVVGSNISGNEIDIISRGDTTISASTVIADNDLNISAGGDVNIESAEQHSESYYKKEVKKSGFMSGGGVGISYGKEQAKTTQTTDNTEQVGSLVGSISGNVNINAGQDVNIKASDVIAGQDINIEGDSVTIESQDNIYNFHNRFEYKKSGVTVSLGGSSMGVINSVWQPIQRATEVSDDRTKALYGVKAGMELEKHLTANSQFTNDIINNASKQLDALETKWLNNEITTKEFMDGSNQIAADADKAIGDNQLFTGKNTWSVDISFGSSKSVSETNSTTVIAQGSNVAAGSDVNITAREKDITIEGSKVSGENVTLEAKENINILASDNTNTSKTDSKSSSSSIGVSVGFGGGIGGFASASKSEGKIRENGTTWNESIVDASGTLTIKSGEDTNIIGSQVKGDTVDMQVGGNLNIESLQDTEKYKETNKGVSVGIGVSPGGKVGVSGGASNQKINSDYESVNEQAGIYAGEGGFDIEVGGNTNLKGAVIASEADAKDNKLSTGTLTYSDLENKAEYDANTVGVNVNHSFGNGKEAGSAQKPYETQANPANKDKGITPNISGSDGNASSTTKSAISEGEIEIRDNPDQDISDLSRDTGNANNPLNPIFDRDKILEKQEAAAVFGEIGFKVAGDIIAHNRWNHDDPRSIALHALVGGIMSEINGGEFGEGLTVAAINKIVIAKLKENTDLSTEEARWISAVLGAALSEAIGGNAGQGAGIADSATRNNDYAHESKVKNGDKVEKDGQLYLVITDENGGQALIPEAQLNVGDIIFVPDGNIGADDGAAYGTRYIIGEDGKTKIEFDLKADSIDIGGLSLDMVYAVDPKTKEPIFINGQYVYPDKGLNNDKYNVLGLVLGNSVLGDVARGMKPNQYLSVALQSSAAGGKTGQVILTIDGTGNLYIGFGGGYSKDVVPSSIPTVSMSFGTVIGKNKLDDLGMADILSGASVNFSADGFIGVSGGTTLNGQMLAEFIVTSSPGVSGMVNESIHIGNILNK